MRDIDINSFNRFVLLCTFLFYIMLRYYKHSILKSETVNRKSNLIYVMFVPASLYSFYYLFLHNSSTTDIASVLSQPSVAKSVSEDLLSSPYPNSSV